MRVKLTTYLLLLAISIIVFSQDQDNIQLANEYYQQGDLEKAKVLYSELAESPYNTQLIASNYLSLLKSLRNYKEAEKFLKDAIRRFPSNMQFQANLAGLYSDAGDLDRLAEYISKIKKESKSNPFQLSILAQYLVNEELYYEAIDFFKISRESRGIESIHALELAAIYRIVNDKPAMIEEYQTMHLIAQTD